MRRRVWCETLPLAEVGSPEVIALLARHRLELLLAVRPWELDALGEVVTRLRAAGVWVGLWPMLADADGRWASVHSAAAFVAFADQALAAAPDADELVVDLEPPIATLARWRDARPARRPRVPRGAYVAARSRLVAATSRWGASRRVSTAIIPALPFEIGGEWMQRWLGTPATALPVAAHSVMMYTSLAEGWSRGLVHRRGAERLLAACARRTVARFGARAALSLGTVGPGAFGDEPSYRDPDELARDVAIADAAGVRELALFELGGVLRRAPAAAWLEAFGAPAQA